MRNEFVKQPIVKSLVAIFNENDSSVLFQFDKNKPNLLRFPGGKVKNGETGLNCIMREITNEEYSLKLKQIKLWIICENFFMNNNGIIHELLLVHSAKLANIDYSFPITHSEYGEILLDWLDIKVIEKYLVVPNGISTMLQKNRNSIYHFSNFNKL